MKRLVIELDDKEHKELKVKAAKAGRAIRDIVRALLSGWMDRN